METGAEWRRRRRTGCGVQATARKGRAGRCVVGYTGTMVMVGEASRKVRLRPPALRFFA